MRVLTVCGISISPKLRVNVSILAVFHVSPSLVTNILKLLKRRHISRHGQEQHLLIFFRRTKSCIKINRWVYILFRQRNDINRMVWCIEQHLNLTLLHIRVKILITLDSLIDKVVIIIKNLLAAPIIEFLSDVGSQPREMVHFNLIPFEYMRCNRVMLYLNVISFIIFSHFH